jgi:two-component system, chemotaxis family, chemotaxis protein CheY
MVIYANNAFVHPIFWVHLRSKNSGMKILVVDDELDVQSLFEQRFRREVRSGAIELLFAHSGEEALRILDEQVSEVVMILSDINMPGMTGIELLRRLKLKYKAPPPLVMMITAYGDDDSRKQAIDYGADDFLSKPIDFMSLKEKITHIQQA